MDVIGFPCASLGSSTVQLHDSPGSRRACACSEAGFSSENGERAWGVYYWRAAFCCAFFLWEKRLNAKAIHKEMFSVYGGKCVSRKEVHNWVEKRGTRFADDEEAETEVRTWLRQQSKDFYAAGFDTLVKRRDNSIKCWWRICQEINVFSSFECHKFLAFVSICDLFTDSSLWFIHRKLLYGR
jgi:hypothetical protein